MRKTLAALAVASGFVSLVPLTAVAGPVAPPSQRVGVAASVTAQPAEWYCGPRCEYWHHRRWEEHRRREESHRWHHYHGYGYNYGNGYYRYY
jgi:sterol desaturase/sphingolipid hydroxylase (fatty acid hydroxylase superfamily)